MKLNNLQKFKLCVILIKDLLKQNLIDEEEFENSVLELKKIYNIQEVAFE